VSPDFSRSIRRTVLWLATSREAATRAYLGHRPNTYAVRSMLSNFALITASLLETAMIGKSIIMTS
jgi:hypothetical protein